MNNIDNIKSISITQKSISILFNVTLIINSYYYNDYKTIQEGTPYGTRGP